MQLQYALKRYHVPTEICKLIFNYYEGLFGKVVTKDWSSSWFSFEIGLFQGCTASTINFDVAFQPLLDIVTTLAGDVGYDFKEANFRVPPLVYADDVEFLTSTTGQNSTCLNSLQTALEWSQTMQANPSKCRSLAFKLFKDKKSISKVLSTMYSCFDPLLQIANQKIPFIGNDNPPCYKYLGRWIQHDLKDNWVRETFKAKLEKWLEVVDKTLLTGPMKAWIANHHVCSKATWTLMIYDFPESEAKEWQSSVHRYYRKWIGLNATTEPSILYRASNHFGLNFKDLRILKQSQVVRWHILKYAKDPLARKLYAYRLSQDQAGHIGKGRKSAPSLELESSEGL